MRISIVGGSGSGKSTLARRLATELGIPHIELDAINWQPGWIDLNTPDRPEFQRRTEEAISGDAWVTDGNYSSVSPSIRQRATDIIWLNYSRPVIMARVIRRSFARALSRQELWPGTGNKETFARWLDKEHPIRWSWDTYHPQKARYEAIFADPQNAHLRLHRLRHPRETDGLVGVLRSFCVGGTPGIGA